MQEASPSFRSSSANAASRAVRRILCVLAPVVYVHGQPVHAACTPEPTASHDSIACQGVSSGPLDAGEGNDTVTNQGTLQASDENTDSVRPQPPGFDELGSGDADYSIGSESNALQGGTGNDTLGNTGLASSSALTQLDSLSLPLTLAGGLDVSATTAVMAGATGMAGGDGGDRLTSAGRVDATAQSVLASGNVEVNGADTTHGDATTTVSADARGIDAGPGTGDSVTNTGEVHAVARADSATSNVEVNLIDAALADSRLLVEAGASALVAGLGAGTLDNSGSVVALAEAQSTDVSANMTYLDVTLVEVELVKPDTADAGTTVSAVATGLDGIASTGGLTLTNSGDVDVNAVSTLDALAISLASEGVPASLKSVIDELTGDAAIIEIGIQSVARAQGAVGGQGTDVATNTGTIRADAQSSARQASVNVGMALIDWGIPTPGIVIGGAGTWASADALGIDGGQGDDTVTNDASITATSDASAGALTVSANISGFTDNPAGGGSSPLGSLGFSVAVADTKNLAQADAVGLRGGGGNDTVGNAGAIHADADAAGVAVGVSAAINVEFSEGEHMLGANAVASRAGSTAEATAIGIDGGAANHRRGDRVKEVVAITTDNDEIDNTGSLVAEADADTVAVAASLTVGGTVKGAGAVFNVAAADASADSYATAFGVDAGGGHDVVDNRGSIVADAQSGALSVGAGLSISFASQGAVVGVSLARAQATAQSDAAGILGGAGLDALTNEGQVTAHAGAEAQAVAVSVGVAGTKDGLSISGALSDSSGDASAMARGMDGGSDNDSLRNAGAIAISDVTAAATAASISVSLAGVNNGVAVSASLAQTSANATASATGLEGGEGDDQLTNDGSITLSNVDASTVAQSVAVSVSGALTAGATLAASMTDSSATSTVRAAGLSGGAGDDQLVNTGTITATGDIGAAAIAGSTSVSLSGSWQGAALGAALSDASATADTMLVGIDGGTGLDLIDNRGAIHLVGNAESGATSVAVTVNAAMGIGGGLELVDARSSATTQVTGIDAGQGISGVVNSAALDIESWSDAQALGVGVGVTVAIGGNATVVDAAATSTARAIGISEGGSEEGVSDIINIASIDLLADASVDGKAISANLAGYALGETSVTAVAEAQGIRGGIGATRIENRGVINALSQAWGDGWSLAVSGGGRVEGDAGVTAEARSTGITSGAGDDQIDNFAALIVDAHSSAEAVSIAAQLAGSAQANARADAVTEAVALDGGAGNDLLRNSASLEVTATSVSDASNITVTVASSNGADAMNAPTSRAVAMAGGAGNDLALLGGDTVTVAASASSTIDQSSWNLAGATSSRAGAEATATAMALEGGEGDDQLQQQAQSLQVQSTASASASSSGWTFAGDVGTEAALVALAQVSVVDGGTGADSIRNDSAFTATSTATLDSSGGANAVFGNAGNRTRMGATASTIGLDGGADDDLISNAAELTLAAESTVTSTRASYTFAGGASIDEVLTSRAELVGVAGGAGNDRILNTARIGATALASGTTLGGATTGLGGGTDAAGRAHAEAFAIGIDGGSGNDAIDNQGTLHIAAILDPMANNGTDSGVFFGNASVDARVNGGIEAAGINAGDGNDVITNAAGVTVLASSSDRALAYSSADGSEFSFGTAGNGVSHAEILLQGSAGGIHAGDGDDVVLNSGDIVVRLLDLAARAETHASSGDTSGYGLGNVNATARAWGTGIGLGDGANRLENEGAIEVDASAQAWGLSGVGAVSFYNGHSTIHSTAVGEARGLSAGMGNQWIVNSGDVRVTASPIAESHASVDSGNDSGDAVGTTVNIATGRGWGIETGDGDTHIVNAGLLSVVAAPQARAPDAFGNMNVFAYGDHPDLDTTNGDAEAYVQSEATAEAHGIRAGTGRHFIDNAGRIEVTANAFAEGGYDVNAGNGPDGHANTVTRLYAFGTATGIAIAGGDATIRNSGDITAVAAPVAAMAHAWGDNGPLQYQESAGSATGIQGGSQSGDQSVINDGHIDVLASGSVQGYTDGRPLDLGPYRLGSAPEATGVMLQGDGYKVVQNNGVITATGISLSTQVADTALASGIRVAGDGVAVTNNGIITAQIGGLGTSLRAGTAIHMNSLRGQELMLRLGRESVTNGHVVMTGGAATLVLDGNPLLNGSLAVDPSRDFSLVLENDGFFGHALPLVASVAKQGAGTFRLPTLNTVGAMTLTDGTLELESGYSFSAAGTLEASIRGDGRHGALLSGGTVHLDGTLRVSGDDDLYSDHARYRIIAAGAIAPASGFDAVQLPASSALVTFSAERSATAFDVVTQVARFESLAQSATTRSIAHALDAAAAGSSGEMRQHLAAIQRLSLADLQGTYQSLNPVFYEYLSTAAAGNATQLADALWQRLADPGELVQPEVGVWLRGFGRTGEQDARGTHAGHDFQQGGMGIGYDRFIGRYTVGGSLGFVNHRLDGRDEPGRSRVDSTLYSVYGGYSDTWRHLDALLTWGRNDYHLARQVVVGQFSSDASGTRSGETLSLGVSGGTLHAFRGWDFGPSASLQYIRLGEPGFTEQGGPLALQVSPRTTHTLAVSAGGRLSRSIRMRAGEWIPGISVALRQDLSLGDRSIEAAFIGAPDAGFVVSEGALPHLGVLTSAGVTWRSGGFAARLTWNGEFRGGSGAHGLFAGIRYML
ncbi:MAG: autotransporter domain-containing protein [Chloroflexota bacterium]|nr:autotransporter domain-containing protein [Chloroflexota bacterium]